MDGFAVALKRLMALSDKSVTEMAAGCDVSRQTVYRWVNGQALPNSQHIQRIADVLGVDQSALTGGTAEYVRRQAVRQLADVAAKLSDTELCMLLKMANEFYKTGERIRQLEESIVTLRMLPKG